MTRVKKPEVQMKTYSGSDIAQMYGYSVELQATWRSKGYLADYGKQGSTGRYVYGYLDLVGFFIAGLLRQYIGVEMALIKGRADANTLLHWAKALTSEVKCAAPRYRVFTKSITEERTGGDYAVENLDDLDEDSTPVMVVVDFKEMASDMPVLLMALAPFVETE